MVFKSAPKIFFSVCMLTLTSVFCLSLEARQKSNTFTDFNGDGFADLAIPVPFEDFQGNVDAGAINIQFGTATGFRTSKNQLITLKSMNLSSKAGDLLGWDGVATDINGDGFTDLVVSAPGRNDREGAVYIIPGSSSGVQAKLVTELVMPTTSQKKLPARPGKDDGNLLGTCITAGDFNGDGNVDVAAGAVGFNTSSKQDLGAIALFTQIPQILRRSAKLTISANAIITPDSPGIKGTGQSTERFGTECAAGFFNADNISDIAVATARPSGKGSVHILFGGPTVSFETNKLIKGKKGDRLFGFAIDTDRSISPNRLFIGAPLSLNSKGRVYSLTNTSDLKVVFTGTNNGDLSGWSLASYNVPNGIFLGIGSPGFDVPGPTPSSSTKSVIEDGGQIVVMSVGPTSSPPSFFDEFSNPNPTTRLLGHSLTSFIASSTSLIAGAPGTSLSGLGDAGECEQLVFDPNAGGLMLVRSITQSSPGVKDAPEIGDQFGRSAVVFIPQ